MDGETSYSDAEVQIVAEKLADELHNVSNLILGYLLKSEEYRRGPLGILSLWSSEHNPRGKFPIEAEALTMSQRAIVTRIVRKAMAEVGRDNGEKKEPINFGPIGLGMTDGWSSQELADKKEQVRIDTIHRMLNKKDIA